MSAYRDLEADYQEWRQLAEAEGEAIRTGDWIQVCNCQNALQFLQPRIIQHTVAAQEECAATHGNATEQEEGVRALVRPLIDLERRNATLLDERLRSAEAELGKFKLATQNLRRIQSRYAPAQTAAWSSFS